jgi:hypothetical protein
MNLYLSSYEYEEFDIPRKVLHFERLQLDNRDVLAVEVKQPLNGQKYGLLGEEITMIFLVNRVDERAFISLNRFPIDVHILIIKSLKTFLPHSMDELQNIAWGCLYDNELDAKNHLIG